MVNSPFDMYGMRQQPDSRGACVRIDMAVIAQNIRSIKAALGRDVRMMAVVKANAYGHGLLACGSENCGTLRR
ncbi:MAG: alanine racemase [Clostridia bacterium]|nr:alanine racemase [Clostridia bacterium]